MPDINQFLYYLPMTENILKVPQNLILKMTPIKTANNACMVESQLTASQYKQNSSYGAYESWKTRILCRKAMRYFKQIWGTKPDRVSRPLVSHEVTKLVKIGNHNISNQFLNSINLKKTMQSNLSHIFMTSNHQTNILYYERVGTTSTEYGSTKYFIHKNIDIYNNKSLSTIPKLHKNSYFWKTKTRRWTIIREASGPPMAQNAAR